MKIINSINTLLHSEIPRIAKKISIITKIDKRMEHNTVN
jgi:hypothetical protein